MGENIVQEAIVVSAGGLLDQIDLHRRCQVGWWGAWCGLAAGVAAVSYYRSDIAIGGFIFCILMFAVHAAVIAGLRRQLRRIRKETLTLVDHLVVIRRLEKFE